jgi:Flp pilus assembly protein TadD
MDRSFAKFTAALLLGTSLAACSTFGGMGGSSNAPEAKVVKGNTSKASMAADMNTQIHDAENLRVTGDYPGATKILAQLMLVTPDDPRIIGEYGKTLVQSGRAKEGLDFLKRAVQLTPGDWSLYSAMGVGYDETGDYTNARTAYNQALAIRPGNPGVLNNFALSRMQAGDAAGARQLMAQAQIAGAKDPKIAQNVALIASYAPVQGTAAATVKTTATASAKPMPVTAHALPNVPANTVMEPVPHDSKASPVREATSAPHKLTKDAPETRTAAKTAPHKVAATVPATKKAAIAANKTPALRMTADVSTP